MSFDVPYLSDADIETEANMLLKSFEVKYGTIQTAATPLDEIIENHLGLGFEITDLGHPAILGQLDIKQNLIRINTLLDPHQDRRKEGRYNYTLAHEGGHQVLHRPYAEALMEAPSLFDGEEEENEIILCRREDQKAPIEIQADKFAACLLMPRSKVIQQFMGFTNRPEGISLQKFIWAIRTNRKVMDFIYPYGSNFPTDEDILHRVFSDMAQNFHVSKQAMVIRLKVLGLLKESAQEEMMYG
jgi:Zn-dependent peptidase ImmA (M78 family)